MLGKPGLGLGDRRRQESDAAAGTVIAQSPVAGTRVKPGTSVDVTIAASALVAVPDLTGETPRDAARLLRRAQLGLGQERQRESEARPGTVIRQSPAPGTRVPRETLVNILVATAPPAPGAAARSVYAAGAAEASDRHRAADRDHAAGGVQATRGDRASDRGGAARRDCAAAACAAGTSGRDAPVRAGRDRAARTAGRDAAPGAAGPQPDPEAGGAAEAGPAAAAGAARCRQRARLRFPRRRPSWPQLRCRSPFSRRVSPRRLGGRRLLHGASAPWPCWAPAVRRTTAYGRRTAPSRCRRCRP